MSKKYLKSRELGDIRAEREMKSFCTALKIFDNPAWICKEYWHQTLYMRSRDTKLYYRALARELFDFLNHLVGWVDPEYLLWGIESYLRKFED